jgi:hypothetical protein
LDSVTAAVVTYWHIARLGILAISFGDVLPNSNNAEQVFRRNASQKTANWLAALISANPAAFRPLLDLHQIELFLVWRAFWQVNRSNDLFSWLHGLRNCLLVRRAGATPLPFLEGGNSLRTVFEAVATEQKPSEFCDQSSMLLLCLLEWCFSLPTARRDQLLHSYYTQLVLGRDSEGQPLGDSQPIDLLGWVPPEDWGRKVLVQSLALEGESQAFETLGPDAIQNPAAIVEHFENFIRKSRSARKTSFPELLPVSVVILACLKHRSPLPAELWRISIFGENPPDLSS